MTNLDRTLRATAPDADPEAASAAARRVVSRAARDRLVDLAYTTVRSPIGELVTVCSRRGLLCLSYQADRVDDLVEGVARAVSPRIVESPDWFENVHRQLDEYFAGQRQEFDLPLDWRLSHGFYRRVLRETARIPYGRAASYRDVAARAGSPQAVRAAGNALGSNPIAIVVPCHRVLRTGGGLGGYGGGLERKRYLLELEGALEG
jgi:methylated-DNA-[protein]-cysteine S-methyltransferase